MSKLDFSQPLLDLDGSQVQDRGVDVTFKQVATRALMHDAPSDKGDGKLARFFLATKIHAASEPIDLSIDEQKLLQDRVREGCGALVVGRFDELLNRKE